MIFTLIFLLFEVTSAMLVLMPNGIDIVGKPTLKCCVALSGTSIAYRTHTFTFLRIGCPSKPTTPDPSVVRLRSLPNFFCSPFLLSFFLKFEVSEWYRNDLVICSTVLRQTNINIIRLLRFASCLSSPPTDLLRQIQENHVIATQSTPPGGA